MYIYTHFCMTMSSSLYDCTDVCVTVWISAYVDISKCPIQYCCLLWHAFISTLRCIDDAVIWPISRSGRSFVYCANLIYLVDLLSWCLLSCFLWCGIQRKYYYLLKIKMKLFGRDIGFHFRMLFKFERLASRGGRPTIAVSTCTISWVRNRIQKNTLYLRKIKTQLFWLHLGRHFEICIKLIIL